MNPSRFAIRQALVVATLCAIILGASSRDDAEARSVFCSIDPLGAYASVGATLFIGTASVDSLPGGGPKRILSFSARDSVTIPAPAFSQVVTIERLSTAAPSDLRTAISRSNGRILLIPWEYGPDCSTLAWRGNALWMKPGTRGLFAGNLRPRGEWVNGVPTFDVGSTYNLPYPSAPAFGRYIRGGIPLSADQLMNYYDSLPRVSYERTDRLTQLTREQANRDALLEWAERHPELAARPPVASFIGSARRETALHPYYVRESEVAGTWRFVVTMPGHDSVIMYGRTKQHPASLIASADGNIRQWDLNERPPFGYYLHIVMTKSLADLDIDRHPPPSRQGYLSVSFEPEIVTPDSTVWSAGADIYGAQAALSDSSTFRSVFASLRRAGTIGIRPDRPRYTPGRIIAKRDGSARLEFEYADNDDTVFPRVRAERISSIAWNPK